MSLFTVYASAWSGLVVFYVILGIYLLYAASQARKRRRLQHELLAKTGGVADDRNFPVKYASGKFFKSLMKVFPWEAAGILRLTDEGLLFDGQTTRGVPVQLSFPAATTTVSWTGRKAINGATAWMALTHGADTHYVTAETGATLRNTTADTQRILQAVEAHLLARTLGDGPTA